MRSRIVRYGGLFGVIAIAALLVSTAPVSAAPGDGSAYGATVDVKLLGTNAVHAGPFAEASTSGARTGHLASVNLPGVLTTGVINAAANRNSSTGGVTADASTADVALPLLSALGRVGAQVLEAKCSAVQHGVSGSASVVGASLGRIGTVAADPAPNTTLEVALPAVGNVARLTFNEQIHNSDGSLTVRALHVHLLGSGLAGTVGSGDVIVSSATCGPAGLPVPLASGLGLWIGLGVLAVVAVPASLVALRRRRAGVPAVA